MDLYRRSVALYGRFSPGQRERLVREITQRGGSVVRDLTRRSDMLVVGGLATTLIDSGMLGKRMRTAAERSVPVFGERTFANAIAGKGVDNATLPLATALAPTGLKLEDALLLAAFDLIVVQGENCRFADAAQIRAAAELINQRGSRAEVVRMLVKVRDKAPTGRRKVVLGPAGKGALQWDSGLTTLEGQGFLPMLDQPHLSIDEVFEQAELAEADGEHDAAAKLYDTCAQSEKADPIAPYNLGNIRLAQEDFSEAIIAYQRALGRDSDFAEARYNLALAYEAMGKLGQAAEELEQALAIDPLYYDAMFNLAQLRMKEGDIATAKYHFERYLASNPPADWAATARKAITYCTARLSA
jgi:tetratricopeptide (TPR) repeat protein